MLTASDGLLGLSHNILKMYLYIHGFKSYPFAIN